MFSTTQFNCFFFSFHPAKVEHKYESVHEAVRHGDVEELEAMVKDGASINEIDGTKDKFTPLHWACHVGALEVNTIVLIRYH